MPGHEDTVGADTLPASTSPTPGADPDVTPVPPRIGRHLVIEPLGAGGMGQVFAAYDPELDRRIAIKLLKHEATAQDARARLQREAQATARLNHPNVVQVYDVGVHGGGTNEDRGEVYVAMELVEGVTLKQWLLVGRDPRSILDTFVQAGRGLAAAHGAGLVHRDFKPDNVLVGDDGRVRVVDFGLAVVSGGSSGGGPAVDTPDRSTGSRPLESVTVRGSLVGTPAYMSPEQLRGEETDARSDQFSFCVALVEALTKQHPFEGAGLHERMSAVLLGRRRAWPRPSPVPRGIEQALDRGLSLEPGDRMQSMEPLLDLLGRDPRERRRRWLTVAGTGALLVGLGVAALIPAQGDACEAGEVEMEGTWGPEKADRLRERFASTGVQFAADSAERVIAELDAYALQWTRQRFEACDATRSGAASQHLMDLKMECLDSRKLAMSALVRDLLDTEPAEVVDAVPAVYRLSSLHRCVDREALEAGRLVPDDPQLAARVQEARRDLVRIEMAIAAGRLHRAGAHIDLWLDDAATEFDPLRAELLAMRARTRPKRTSLIERTSDLEEAYWLAYANGDRELAASVATTLIGQWGEERDDYEAGLRWARHAKAAITLAGDAELLRYEYFRELSSIKHAHGDHAEAIDYAQRCLGMAEESFEDEDPRRGDAMEMLVVALWGADRNHEALEKAKELLVRRERTYGKTHPRVAAALNQVGGTAYQHRELELAESSLTRAVEILDSNSVDPLGVASALNNLAAVKAQMGKDAEAREMFERLITLRREHLGADHNLTLGTMTNLGLLHAQAGNLDRAHEILGEAVQRTEKKLGPDSANLVHRLTSLGINDYKREAYAEARKHLDHACSLSEKHFGRDSLSFANCQEARGRVWAAQGDVVTALEAEREVLEIWRKFGEDDSRFLQVQRIIDELEGPPKG